MKSLRVTLIKYLLFLAILENVFLLIIPDEYDVRQSFYDIRDQKMCGGCWAFAAAEVISDRYCINSNGKAQLLFSEMELLTCCKTLEDNPDEGGCGGGHPQIAFNYWVSKGLPTKSCKEFLFNNNEYPKDNKNKLKCLDTCSTKGINLIKYKGSFVKKIEGGEEEIKKEIFNNGPVTAGFLLYKDFFNYWGHDLALDPNKIYQHFDGDFNGTHAIKIIGWGIDSTSQKKYWLCVNSWGKNENITGIFRFIRGINDCGIESEVYAGYVDHIFYSSFEPIYVFKDTFIASKI